MLVIVINLLILLSFSTPLLATLHSHEYNVTEQKEDQFAENNDLILTNTTTRSTDLSSEAYSTEGYYTSTWNTTFPVDPKANDDASCPKGLEFYRHFLGTPFCYILTEKQPFPPTCPYQNYLDYDTIIEISEKYKHQSIWLRAQRDNESGFGEFEWLVPSNRYGTSVREYQSPGNDIMEKNCMIRKLDKHIPVFCNEEHPVLCVYSYTSRAIEKYCSKRNQFNRCISTSLHLDNQCFCLAHVEGLEISRNDFCQKLAEPLEPFQNHMLLTELTNKSPCWFGLEKVADDGFHWSTLNKSVSYTYWKDNADTSKRYGALDYAKPRGWILQDDYSLKCAVCETEVDYQNVTIRLKHLPNVDKIQLSIQNVFDVHNYFILQYILACFTDSNVDGLKTKIVSMITDLFSVNHQYYVKNIKLNNYYPSYYWCETYQRPNLTLVVSNRILAYKDTGKHRHEYALIVKVAVPKGIDPYLRNIHVEAAQFVSDALHRQTTIVNAVRPMKVLELSQADEYMSLLLHMSSTKSNFTADEEYVTIKDMLNELPEMAPSIILSISKFTRSEVCLAETTKSGSTVLHWPETNVGVTSLPKELCLLRNSTPVVRKCEGDFLYGGTWGEVQGECSSKANLTQTTIALYSLLNSEESCENLSRTLHRITEYNKDVMMVDIYFVTEILGKLTASNNINLTEISCTVSNMMQFNKHALKESQALLNCTDKALHILDTICSSTELSKNNDYFHVETDKILIQISDLRTSNITGAVIRKVESVAGNITLSIEPLYNNTSIETLLLENDVDAAVLLPQEHIRELSECIKEEQYSEMRLIITFFYDDALFNEVLLENRNRHYSNGRIINVFIPGSFCTFHIPIDIIFKPFNDETKMNCGHWNYGNNEIMESTYGSWKIDTLPDSTKNKYTICQYNHTTHFALLMFNEYRQEEIPPEDVFALNIITAIGCGLSLLGLLGIFVTAIAFKKWRRRSRNIIMLNFSVSLAAQMILLFVADNVHEDSLVCLISGASLHYTVLSEFAWMLMIAILQYQKFVLVFQKPIPYLLLKCIIVGWCLPLIPVAAIFAIYPETYTQNSVGLCYPKNEYFLYGLALPIAIIILINLFVFFKIIVNICNRKVKVYGSKESDIKLQVLLAILLFFLLGMSWLFGLATVFIPWIILSYIFCLTATLQGFVIFLFFILMNKQSRSLWLNIKKICFCAKQ